MKLFPHLRIRFAGRACLALMLGCAAGCAPLGTQRLPYEQILVGAVTARVQVAATPQIRERGLMYRTHLDADAGMLFVYPSARRLTFWMKNTLLPLDIGYFDDQGFLIEVHRMIPQPGVSDEKLKTYVSSEPALSALEMNAKWFERHNLRRYARLKLPRDIVAVGD